LARLVPPGHYRLGGEQYHVLWLGRNNDKRVVRLKGETLPEAKVQRILARIALAEGLNRAGDDEAEPRSGMVDAIRARLLDVAGVRALEPPEPLVKGLLSKDSLASLYGPSGIGKSFLGLDLALSVATGTPLFGIPVEAGPVLYVVAEGASGMGRRVDAWCGLHGVYDPEQHHPLWWVRGAINVGQDAWAAALGEVAAEVGAVLVVIDTLARCTVGIEENSAKEMGLVVANLDCIRRATGACVLVIHHTGVADQSRARGSSALRGALDTELELTRNGNGLKLRNPKQKDGPELAPIHLALQPVPSAWGVEGNEDDASCVLVPAEVAAPADTGAVSPETRQKVLAALREIYSGEGIGNNTWIEAAGLSRATWFRAKKDLVDDGSVTNIGSEKRPLWVPIERETP
jgi:hypothetical protein